MPYIIIVKLNNPPRSPFWHATAIGGTLCGIAAAPGDVVDQRRLPDRCPDPPRDEICPWCLPNPKAAGFLTHDLDTFDRLPLAYGVRVRHHCPGGQLHVTALSVQQTWSGYANNEHEAANYIARVYFGLPITHLT